MGAPRVGSETRTGSGPRDDAPARDGVCSMHDQYSTLAWRLPGKSRLVRRQTSLKPYLQYEPAKCAGATLLTASLANGAGARLFFLQLVSVQGLALEEGIGPVRVLFTVESGPLQKK